MKKLAPISVFAWKTWPSRGRFRADLSHLWKFRGGLLMASLLYWALFSIVSPVCGAIHYVNPASRTPLPPFTTWTTASTNLQAAIDSAIDGDDVIVTNGVYQTVRDVNGEPTVLAALKTINVRSLNGPEVTVLDGNGTARCAFFAMGATLSGFTLTRGRAIYGGGVAGSSFDTALIVSNCVITGNSASSGGGAYNCMLTMCTISGNAANGDGGGTMSASLSDCLISHNSSGSWGGGAAGGILKRCTMEGNTALFGGGASRSAMTSCTLIGNSARGYYGNGGGAAVCTLTNCFVSNNSAFGNFGNGGGIYGGIVNNCTITGNSANHAGGAYGCAVYNSIVYHNEARLSGDNYSLLPFGDNYPIVTFHHSCTLPLPLKGVGNIDQEPRLASASHLSIQSPCRGAGDPSMSKGTDIDGEPWINPPSIGCDEPFPMSDPATLTVAIGAPVTNAAPGVSLNMSAWIEGGLAESQWDFGDGTQVTNMPFVSHAWKTSGDYTVSLRAYRGDSVKAVTSTISIHVAESIHYVSQHSSNPVPPYLSWETAATNIQDAVDAAVWGGLVLVDSGVYRTGSRLVSGISGTTANRVAIEAPLTVKSVHGPAVTLIEGSPSGGESEDDPAVRCAFLGKGTTLSGFTLTNGSAGSFSQDSEVDGHGGGVFCTSTNAIVTRCVFKGNEAAGSGGGAFGASLIGCFLSENNADQGAGAASCLLWNCALINNTASSGAGASSSRLNNCTVTGNRATSTGGGIAGGTANNCVVYYNSASDSGDNFSKAELSYSCTTPLPTNGVGNISAAPELADVQHISIASPCRQAGSSFYSLGLDLDGDPWSTPPSMGCDEYIPRADAGPLVVSIQANHTDVAPNFPVEFEARMDGIPNASRWDFGDGTIVSNRPYASHTFTKAGDYTVSLTAYAQGHVQGETARISIHVPEGLYYVSERNSTPVPPYTTWSTAATNIQQAVDAAVWGGVVVVTNGIYQTGGAVAGWGLTNRVAVLRPITVRSVNGPEVTAIVGYQMPETINGPAAVRCVYLAEGATLAGFTLTNGATRLDQDRDEDADEDTNDPQAYHYLNGGGVWCASVTALVSNCVLEGNAAYLRGGGAHGGTLIDCKLTRNVAIDGGGAVLSILKDCLVASNVAYEGIGGLLECNIERSEISRNVPGGARGGYLTHCRIVDNSGEGALMGTLFNCTIAGNSGVGAAGATLHNCSIVGNRGGGVVEANLNNCDLSGNSTLGNGGGAQNSYLLNCTVTGNLAERGGGVFGGWIFNSIVYNNKARFEGDNHTAGEQFSYSCTSPLPAEGAGNIGEDPRLVTQTHLGSDSPCRGAGDSTYARGVDIDGEAWAAPPSIGCDEFTSKPFTGALAVGIGASYTNVSTGFQVEFQAQIVGRVTDHRWDFGDGTVISNRAYVSHSWNKPGDYTVSLLAYNQDHPEGVSSSFTIHVVTPPIHYVSASSAAPVAPYLTWETAAATIQDAVEAAEVFGALILVTNGIYQTGGASGDGLLTNRVAVTKPLTVRSVNGPGFTTVVGCQDPASTNGSRAIRCAYLANGASLQGFTLVGGATLSSPNGLLSDGIGGGIHCEGPAAVVSNCVIRGNTAAFYGGGVSGGTLRDCVIGENRAPAGGGVYLSRVTDCSLQDNVAISGGGGALEGTLEKCILRGNRADHGGGATGATLLTCTLTNNRAQVFGGGAAFSDLNDCLLTENEASGILVPSEFDYRTHGGGGGAYACTLYRSSLVANRTGGTGGGTYQSTLDNCSLHRNASGNGGGATAYGTLENCTLTGNRTVSDGGGAYGSTLRNCTLYRNAAGGSGGAAVGGTLENCTLQGNTAVFRGGGTYESRLKGCVIAGNACQQAGGGANGGTLLNCTVTGNIAPQAGGVISVFVTNSIVYHNFSYGSQSDNHSFSSFSFSCTTPLPPGLGNLEVDPQLANATHLLPDSPCASAGSALAASGTDLDGETWLTPPSMGADQVTTGASRGNLQIALLGGNPHAAIGSTVTLSSIVGGEGTLRFQWRKNGANILDATNTTYTLDNVQSGDGGTYSAVVENDTGSLISDPIILIVEPPNTPTADDFSQRVLIEGYSGFVSGTNAWATRERGEPFHAGKFGTNSVWYRWTAPASGIATLRTIGSTFDTLVGVYTGTRVDKLTLVAEDEDRGGFLTSVVRFNAKAGVSYSIAIDGFAGAVGTFILTWNLEATSEELPVIRAQPQSQTVPPGSAVNLTVAAAGTGLSYQWLFNGQPIAGAVTRSLNLNQVTPPNVGHYTVAITNSAGRGMISLPASVEIGNEPGVHAQDKLEDLFQSPTLPPPPGPSLASFVSTFLPLTMGSVATHIASTVDATTQSWEPSHCGSLGGASIWFEFQSNTNGRVLIDTQGSTFDTVVAVYRKVGIRDLRQNEIACNTDARQGNGWSQIVFDAERGSNYWVVVDGANPRDLSGRVHLNYAMGRPPKIEAPPLFSVVHAGETRRLEAHASDGFPSPEYQWLKDGEPLQGATNSWLEVKEESYADSGLYSVALRNAVGEVQQIVASVTSPWYTGKAIPSLGIYRIHLFPVPTRGANLILEESNNFRAWKELFTHKDADNPRDLDISLHGVRMGLFRVRLELP